MISIYCTKGVSFVVTDDDGMYETGPNQNRVKHLNYNEYIRYQFSFTPASGVGQGFRNVIWGQATLYFHSNDYRNAHVGTYTYRHGYFDYNALT